MQSTLPPSRVMFPSPSEEKQGITTDETKPCEHEFLRSDGTCNQCGLHVQTLNMVSNTGTYGTARTFTRGSSSSKGLTSDLQKYSLPDEIKARANEIYKKMHNVTHRGSTRLLLIFFCVFNAYRELHIDKDSRELAKVLGLERHKIQKAFSTFSEVNSGYRSPRPQVNPLSYLNEYRERLMTELDIDQGQLLGFASEILRKAPKLEEKYPKKVAIGILGYFLRILGVSFDLKVFAERMGFSGALVEGMIREISEVHNG